MCMYVDKTLCFSILYRSEGIKNKMTRTRIEYNSIDNNMLLG